MEKTTILDRCLRAAGGAANISRHTRRGHTLFLVLKDSGMADLPTLRGMEEVAEAELDRGRLRITLRGGATQEESQMADNKQIARDVLKAVGGKENVKSATHCMTRLRLVLNDEAMADDDTVKAIAGVLGLVHSGGQYQIIIGQNVPKVYEEVCKLTGLAEKAAPVEETRKKPP